MITSRTFQICGWNIHGVRIGEIESSNMWRMSSTTIAVGMAGIRKEYFPWMSLKCMIGSTHIENSLHTRQRRGWQFLSCIKSCWSPWGPSKGLLAGVDGFWALVPPQRRALHGQFRKQKRSKQSDFVQAIVLCKQNDITPTGRIR